MFGILKNNYLNKKNERTTYVTVAQLLFLENNH